MTISRERVRQSAANPPNVEPERPILRSSRRRNADIGEAHAQPWVYAVLAGGLVLLVGPFLWMLLGSFRPDRELKMVPPTWLPQHWTLENYRQLYHQLDLLQVFFNSTLVAVTITVGNLAFCSMLGYAFAKLNFPGKRVMFSLVLATLMVPGVVTLVPLFVLVSNLGMANSYAGLIFPFVAGPFGVFLMRQFMLGLPNELIDAARVDGAGEFRIFASVIMPLCKPALATLGILTFLTSWNNFLWPLVVAQSEDKYTLPVALAIYAIGENKSNYGLLMAGSVAIIVPVLIVFIALQRHFVRGIALTGIK
jgi:multiple sugar transport system permease protein